MKTILILIIFLSAPAQAENLQAQFLHLSKKEISVLKQACLAGISNNLCLTMAAIAWQESDLGLYQINLQDPSAGIYHIKISNAIKDTTLKNTRFNRNRVAMWLIRYPNWAAKLAISELKFWLRYWHHNWFKSIGSYNGGYHSNKRYARAIASKVRFLRKHIRY